MHTDSNINSHTYIMLVKHKLITLYDASRTPDSGARYLLNTLKIGYESHTRSAINDFMKLEI
jgi:hypothetical protein